MSEYHNQTDSIINHDSEPISEARESFEQGSGEPSGRTQSNEEDSRFKDGELLNLIRVRFPGNARSFPFLVGKKKFQYGQKVMAMSDRGMTVGYINSFSYQVPFHKTMLPLRTISRLATEEDIRQQIEFRDSEKKAEVVCLRLIERYKLDMVLTHVEFIQFGKKAVFYFNAPERVDFRDLVKDLVQELKMRIELRQISVRDRAAALGSIGACGLQTCCSSFLKNYGNVTIKMAKNQNLALIPTKLNGVCGQIKCCIKYEDEVYTEKRNNLPKEGTIIATKNGDIGKVLNLDLLVEQFTMLTDRGIKRKYFSTQFTKESLELPQNYLFPEYFDNIIDETKTVIGLTPKESFISKKFREFHQLDSELDDEPENHSEENSEEDSFPEVEQSEDLPENLPQEFSQSPTQENPEKRPDNERTPRGPEKHFHRKHSRNHQGHGNRNQRRS